MKNVYILHTQYNLILGTAIKHFAYYNDINILCIQAEFQLKRELIESLEKQFDKVLILSDHYIRSDGLRLKREKELYNAWKSLRPLLTSSIDRIIISQDRKVETAFITKAIARNPRLEVIDVEEDCYYSLNDMYNHITQEEYIDSLRLVSKKTIVCKSLLKYLHRCLYGKDLVEGYYYFYGMNKIFSSSYVLFPDEVRTDMTCPKRIEISKEELLLGIENIYGKCDGKNYSDNCIIWFFDLIERYKSPDSIEEIVRGIIKYCTNYNINFYCKLHPRENKNFDVLNSKCVHIIDRIIPAEKVLLDLQNKNPVILGNVTTVLQVAKKLDFKVISVAKIEENSNTQILDFYKAIGVEMPETTELLLKQFKGEMR